MKSFCASFVFLSFLSQLCFSQQTREEKSDSLSRVGFHVGPSNETPMYLVDSLVLMNPRVFEKVAKHSKYVRLIKKEKDLATFYVHTARTIVIDGTAATQKNQPFDTQRCKMIHTKIISPRKLRSKFGISNGNGGIMVKCYVAQ
ncbi:MAG TPA: hypothetical protein VGD65_24655 [Chryseosolibacter sp.]